MATISNGSVGNPQSSVASLLSGSSLSQLYARTVARHAQKTHRTSLHPGQNYQKLAQFLSQPYGEVIARVSEASSPVDVVQSRSGQPGAQIGSKAFLTIHQYPSTTNSEPTLHEYSADETGQQAFEKHHKMVNPGTAQLQFMSGFASAQWLNLLGSCFRIDPEFFRRHLSFMLPYNYLDIPSLPSVSSGFVQLPLMTIATRTGGAGAGVKDSLIDLQKFQKNVDMNLSAYLRQIDRDISTGRSIVRQLYVNSAEYYTIEQRVSISINTRSRDRWAALIWLDCGTDTLQSYLSEWFLPWKTAIFYFALLPVFQFRERIAKQVDAALPRRTYNDSPAHEQQAHNNSTHSAALLARNYGQSLEPAVVQADAFYALSELFAFSAASENQFLNLLETTVHNERDPPLARMEAAQQNLQAVKIILESHIHLQRSVVATIKARGSPAWPKAREKTHIEAVDETAIQLLGDWNHLLSRSLDLSAQCNDLADRVTNKAMLVEAQRGIAQAEGLARLTLLAFFFVPLSFTTSFFGMSFKELGSSSGPTLRIYVWFCVSAPLFLASLTFLYWVRLKDYLAQNGIFES